MRDDLFDLIWCGVVLLWNEVRGQITFCYYFSEFCIFIDVNIWPSGFGLLVSAFQPCLVIIGNNKNLERLRAGLKIQKVGERERERERERETSKQIQTQCTMLWIQMFILQSFNFCFDQKSYSTSTETKIMWS